MIFRSHFISMAAYAFFVAVVLSLIRREGLKSQFKYGLTLFLLMVAGAVAFGWLMYLFAR
jgi:hypothetical protein